MQLSQIKKEISKINRKIVDWTRYKLSEDESGKYNVDSDLYLKSGHISLLSARHVVFWIQDSGYKHTSSHEELAQIFNLVSSFVDKYQKIDNSIKAIQKELAQLKPADLQQEASAELESAYRDINLQYEHFIAAQKDLVDKSSLLKSKTLLQREEVATSPEEPVGNESPIIELFDYFKQDLQHKFEQGKLNEAILKQKPQELLITFIEAMLVDASSPAAKHVCQVVNDLGGRIMILEAFNTDSAKKHGVLKTATGKNLLKEVADLMINYKKSLPNSIAPAESNMKQRLQDQREQAQKEQVDTPNGCRP